MKKFCLGIAVSLLLNSPCFALTVKMALTDKAKTPIGTIELSDSPHGVLISPHLKSLPPGPHGFHMHANPSCADAGQGASGHYDPENTGKHLGPYAKGHLGDLPILWVCADGTTTAPMLAPRLKLSDFTGHSLMIHAGGDNYSDTPEKLGGGAARIACGVIEKSSSD